MVFLKSRYIPNLQESYICEYFFSPSCLQVFISCNVSELRNILGFINASKCENFNTPAVNIMVCYCRAAQGAAHQLSVFLLPPSQMAAGTFCNKTCKCKSPSSLKFCAVPLAEGTLNALHYARYTWKMGSEMSTTSSEKKFVLMNSFIPYIFIPVTC